MIKTPFVHQTFVEILKNRVLSLYRQPFVYRLKWLRVEPQIIIVAISKESPRIVVRYLVYFSDVLQRRGGTSEVVQVALLPILFRLRLHVLHVQRGCGVSVEPFRWLRWAEHIFGFLEVFVNASCKFVQLFKSMVALDRVWESWSKNVNLWCQHVCRVCLVWVFGVEYLHVVVAAGDQLFVYLLLAYRNVYRINRRHVHFVGWFWLRGSLVEVMSKLHFKRKNRLRFIANLSPKRRLQPFRVRSG